MMLVDTLVERIAACKAPVVVGLDPVIESIPDAYFADYDDSLEGVSAAIYDFNKDVIDAIEGLVPAVKPQIAFYEMFGSAGIASFEKTARYAKAKGFVVVEDGKRNDIGNTARAYAQGHLGKVRLNRKEVSSPFNLDFLTVSPFLGEESLEPFIHVCREYDKGIFILVRTSNPGNRMVQDAKSSEGKTVSEALASYIDTQARLYTGASGYSSIGAVVGATYPREAAALRQAMQTSVFLVPGYGAQGGGAQDVVPCFNEDGLGAIVNSSRGILYSYLAPYGKGCSKTQYRQSVTQATQVMQREIYAALRAHYPKMIY